MSSSMSPKEIVAAMMAKDEFSAWLKIDIISVEAGAVEIEMTIRKEMVNGFGIAHGGISYALADSAFAFASNSNGSHAVSVDSSISHLAAVRIGDRLTAISSKIKQGRSTGTYLVHVTNQDGRPVALFKGTVCVLDKEWETL